MTKQTYAIQMERDLTAKMRDGVILRADVFRPKAEGKFPVLLQRTPYNKANYNANVPTRIRPDPAHTASLKVQAVCSMKRKRS